jgi:hypothetical protein
MPTSYVKKLAKKKKMKISEVEERWQKAKKLSKERKGKRDNWAYTMGIFKKMMKESVLNFKDFIELL